MIEIMGFIALCLVLLYASIFVGFAILFGGEEFSASTGKQLCALLAVAVMLAFFWYKTFESAPFSIELHNSPASAVGEHDNP